MTKNEKKMQENGMHMDGIHSSGEHNIIDELKLQSEIEGSEQKPLEESEIENLISEMTDLKEQHLRLYAEFENYKKRNMKERMELLKSAGSEMLISLLPVVDDFERAIKATADMVEKDPLREGILLVYQKLKIILDQKGLKPMISIGQTFDVDLHEAISNIPVEDPKMKEKVIDEIERGYTFNDKVIRHAKVVVGV